VCSADSCSAAAIGRYGSSAARRERAIWGLTVTGVLLVLVFEAPYVTAQT
jgi:hypothetical protein